MVHNTQHLVELLIKSKGTKLVVSLYNFITPVLLCKLTYIPGIGKLVQQKSHLQKTKNTSDHRFSL